MAEKEGSLMMGLEKNKEKLNLDLNFPVDESFLGLGFQDSSSGLGSSSCSGVLGRVEKEKEKLPDVDFSNRRKFSVEEKAKGIIEIDDDDEDDVVILDNEHDIVVLDNDDDNDVEIDLDLSLGTAKYPFQENTADSYRVDEPIEDRNQRFLLREETSRKHHSIAKRVAQKFAHPEQQEQQGLKRKLSQEDDNELDDSQSPFALAMEVIKNRNSTQKAYKKSLPALSDSLFKWVPAENRGSNVSSRQAPKLLDICLDVLSVNAHKILSLNNVPDDLRHKLSKNVSGHNKVDSHFVELLARDSPTEIRVWNASQLTEDECIQIFCACDTKNLTVLQLDLCGKCMSEYVLHCILAGPLCNLHKLATMSLKGAHRLLDAGVNELAKSARALMSVNLSQCSLLTFDGINILACHFESTLRELYIDDCQNINVMLILPALKKFKHLEVLSVAGIQTVTDDFVIEMVEACGMNMKELVLADCVNLTDISFKFVGKTCPKLCAIDLSRLHNLTDSALKYLANGCRSFCKLKLCRNDFSDEAIAAFLEASGKSLKELSLNNMKKVDLKTALSIVKCLRNLLSLDLSWCRKLTDEALGLIVDRCSSLEVVKIFGCTQVTDVFLKGHSNSRVHVIGHTLTPILDHIDPPGHQGAPLQYSAVTI